DNDGRFHVTKIVPGSKVSDMLAFARYDPVQLQERFERQLAVRVDAGTMPPELAARLSAEYKSAAGQSTYLE
ncbi:MAG TPA: arginine decarboxylase, partial [Planctomycetaceae bacterium]|nr:arginine decarboxylase [Planctomycetaceae bacterium]